MENNFNEKLGQRIKELRIANNLKQSQLADILEMERTNLTRIECGNQRPNDENLIKLAKILNVKIKDLFDFEHVLPEEELKDKITSEINNLSKKELEYLYKTIENLKQLRK
ncbi:helix-turn-helix transcriptional regulator [bacterium]|nr:helix-turn-helix transcriptional regulator [bacterium]